MKAENQTKTHRFDVHKLFRKAKEFVHPTNVTWKTAKDTTHDATIVLAVMVISAILLIAGDIAFGAIMHVLL